MLSLLAYDKSDSCKLTAQLSLTEFAWFRVNGLHGLKTGSLMETLIFSESKNHTEPENLSGVWILKVLIIFPSVDLV